MNYLQKSKEIVSKCLSVPIEQLTEDSCMEQIKPELDSVTFASMMMEVERLLKKEVPVTEWLNVATVSDLSNILERNDKTSS